MVAAAAAVIKMFAVGVIIVLLAIVLGVIVLGVNVLLLRVHRAVQALLLKGDAVKASLLIVDGVQQRLGVSNGEVLYIAGNINKRRIKPTICIIVIDVNPIT